MSRLSEVREVDYGVYVWITEDGKVVTDDNGNYLLIHSMRGDLSRMAKLGAAARHYGVPPGGHPEFVEGARAVSDTEYEEQKQRLFAGETPDEKDAANLLDEGRIERRK